MIIKGVILMYFASVRILFLVLIIINRSVQSIMVSNDNDDDELCEKYESLHEKYKFKIVNVTEFSLVFRAKLSNSSILLANNITCGLIIHVTFKIF